MEVVIVTKDNNWCVAIFAPSDTQQKLMLDRSVSRAQQQV